jgi:hypothetical protein
MSSMNESIVLEIDGNLYPLASLLAAQDSSRIHEADVASTVRSQINGRFFDAVASELVASAGELFTSDITPWLPAYGDNNTPLKNIEEYATDSIVRSVASMARTAFVSPIRLQASELAKEVFDSAIADIVTAQANTLISWLAASEYIRRAVRGEGVKPTIDGQQLLANFDQQCQDICSLIDSHIPPEPQ